MEAETRSGAARGVEKREDEGGKRVAEGGKAAIKVHGNAKARIM